MGDVRRLNLDSAEERNVENIPLDRFKLGTERMSQLEKMLPELMALPYWSPKYQAWEQFLQLYLTSGVNPELASQYLPRLSSKAESLYPKHSAYHNRYLEYLSLTRSSTTEAFRDYSWYEIVEFAQIIPMFTDNIRSIRRYLFNEQNYMAVLSSMLAVKGNAKYSINLPYAVYLYRHCRLEYNPTPLETVIALRSQIEFWIEDFLAEFRAISEFSKGVARCSEWYTDKVGELIAKAWRVSTILGNNSPILDQRTMSAMPVWLSEKVTSYINSLPCVMSIDMHGSYVLDCLDYVFSPTVSFEDTNAVYAFCITKSRLNTAIDHLAQMYRDVCSGEFIAKLRLIIRSNYDNAVFKDELKHPDDYDRELILRGFPLTVGGESHEQQTSSEG